MRKTFIILTLLLLQGCFLDDKGGVSYHPGFEESLVTEVKEGSLYILEDNGSYELQSGALDYRVIPSPEGSWLAVETLKFSKVTFVSFYKKDEDGRYRLEYVPASADLLNEVSDETAFDIDDVDYFRTKFIRWEDEAHAYLNLSGAFQKESIDKNISITLR